MSASRLVGWLAGWLITWLVGWLVSRLVGSLVGWLVGWSRKRMSLLSLWFLVCFLISFSQNTQERIASQRICLASGRFWFGWFGFKRSHRRKLKSHWLQLFSSFFSKEHKIERVCGAGCTQIDGDRPVETHYG